MVTRADDPERRARALLELGRPADALTLTRRGLAKNPSDPELLEVEGLCWLRLEEPLRALEPLERAVAAGSPHASYLLGFALREAGRPAEAERPLREALRRSPDEPVYLRALAELCADLGRPTEGLPLARRATEVAPDRAANHVTCGYVASAAGLKDLARKEYELAVALDPADSAAWNNLGCLDLEAGDLLRARARFREALRLDPEGARAQRNLRLVLPARTLERPDWSGLLGVVAAELVRARVARLTLAALVLEAPEAGASLVRGGTRGAWLTGGVTALLLRELGPFSLVPLGVAGAAAGALWWRYRDQLPPERARVRAQLGRARASFDGLWRAWLDGTLERSARDQAIGDLAEELTLAIAGRKVK